MYIDHHNRKIKAMQIIKLDILKLKVYNKKDKKKIKIKNLSLLYIVCYNTLEHYM